MPIKRPFGYNLPESNQQNTAMNAAELQNFLHRNIPASAALSLTVTESTPNRVALLAPIGINRNHHHTVFGGSTAMLATLCGWSLVRLNYPEYHGIIVIQEGSTRYLKPAAGDLTTVCEAGNPQPWAQCTKMLAERGKGKIAVSCALFSNGVQAAAFEGKYVVLYLCALFVHQSWCPSLIFFMFRISFIAKV